MVFKYILFFILVFATVIVKCVRDELFEKMCQMSRVQLHSTKAVAARKHEPNILLTYTKYIMV
jgi:hypothetical protein